MEYGEKKEDERNNKMNSTLKAETKEAVILKKKMKFVEYVAITIVKTDLTMTMS